MGGYLNVHTHSDNFECLCSATGFVDAAPYFGNIQPMFKHSSNPLDNILLIPESLSRVQGYYVWSFEFICLSDHAAMVLDVNWVAAQEVIIRSDRILSSKNEKNFHQFLSYVY